MAFFKNLRKMALTGSLIVFSSSAHAGLGLMAGCSVSGVMCAVGLITCAPEIYNSNVKVVQRTLQSLAVNELKDSRRFVSLVKQGEKLPAGKAAAFYLNLAGISTNEEAVEFIGQRSIDEKYIDHLAKEAELSRPQARLVAQKISEGLLGKIK